MSGMSRRQQAAQEAELKAARDWGSDYFREHPNLMLVEVSRWAATLFAVKQHQIAFLQGYSQARAQHEEFLMESDRDEYPSAEELQAARRDLYGRD
jgi:hypothetical protein